MKFGAASFVASAVASSWQDVVDTVNGAGSTWTSVVPSKFESVEAVRPYLGAFLPGDEHYTEPAVKEIAVSASDLPASFDAVEQWPQCTVIANVRDQSSCGSCWAFGSASSFESRVCIATGKDVKYSPEDTAFCSNAGNGCNGGNSAWNWFESRGVVTGGDYTDRGAGNTCYPYSLAPCAHHVPATSKYPACPSSEYPSPRCASSCSESGYSKSYSSDKVRASSSYSVRGEQQIMQELVSNGPMYVAFSVYGDFPTYKSGVYKHTSGSYLGGHAVTLVGYGELNGEKYWKIKNSWNEQWGDNGHFLIARGSNECGIEGSVSAGKVSASTVALHTKKQYKKGFKRVEGRNANVEVASITEEMRAAAPAKLDWTTKGATTAVKDQGYCGSCWAYSATEGIESGLFMTTGNIMKLSEQQIVSCDKTDGGCDGGDLPTAFDYVQSAGGIATQSSYPDTSSDAGKDGKCKNKPKVVKVTGYKYAVPPCTGGGCKNQKESDMMAAMNTYGPLSVCVNADWDSYGTGVYTKTCSGKYNKLDHCVQLVGYDTTASTPYWKVRNSWASDWGEEGHIRLPMGENACGIADEAMYVTATEVSEEVAV